MHAVQISETGGPEVLTWDEVPSPIPGPDEVVVRLAAAGLNYIDTYHRSGLYPRDLPFIPGQEGSGTIELLGLDVKGWRIGDRVAWADAGSSYAERVAVPVARAVRVPGPIDLETGAAMMLQGITAHYLATDTFALGPGHRCLIHAGAGGVGQLLIQIAKLLGAEVVATAGGDEKVALAAAAGADHVIDYAQADFVEAVEALFGPHAIDVVYDGVGAATFDGGLRVLRPTRLNGHVRECQRAGTTGCSPPSYPGRQPVSHSPVDEGLHRHPGRTGEPGQRSVRVDRRRSPAGSGWDPVPFG